MSTEQGSPIDISVRRVAFAEQKTLRQMVIQFLFKELLNTLFRVVVDIFDKMVNCYRQDSTINYEMKCKAEERKEKS